ncbi:MAG: hypothetical protein ABW168_26675, partial [Sedimenticola sp.]
CRSNSHETGNGGYNSECLQPTCVRAVILLDNPVEHVVGYDALAVYINKANPAASLSFEQLNTLDHHPLRYKTQGKT